MPALNDPNAVPPDEALTRLIEGNRRFFDRSQEISGLGWRPGLSQGQKPFAVVLGCSDSRAPAELVFDQGLGDLFVVRVAGNVVAPSQIGSVEFAVSQFGTRLVVVMGHSHCGAITATIDSIRSGDTPASRHIRAITERIRPFVEELVIEVAQGRSDGKDLVRRALRANVRASMNQLRHGSLLLEDAVAQGRLVVVGAELDLDTGHVDFFAR